MTRDEQIFEASKIYSEYKYNQTDFENGFINGAKWADVNPSLESLWHDTSEEPEDDLVIIYQDKHGDCWFIAKRDILSINWEVFAAINVMRWAYVKDLLPKGGEK